MRKSKKEIKEPEVILRLLSISPVGRLGTITRDGSPMIKPLNFVYRNRSIYFHSANEGEKIDDIRRDNRVCFEVDLPVAYVKAEGEPCKAKYLYRSVIAKGKAVIIEDAAEKILALGYLMEKYQPEGGYGHFPDGKLGMTCIVRIEIEELTGKEDLGDGETRESVLASLNGVSDQASANTSRFHGE